MEQEQIQQVKEETKIVEAVKEKKDHWINKILMHFMENLFPLGHN